MAQRKRPKRNLPGSKNVDRVYKVQYEDNGHWYWIQHNPINQVDPDVFATIKSAQETAEALCKGKHYRIIATLVKSTGRFVLDGVNEIDEASDDGLYIDEAGDEAFAHGYNDYRKGLQSLYYKSQGVYYHRLPNGGVELEDDRAQAQQYIAGFNLSANS